MINHLRENELWAARGAAAVAIIAGYLESTFVAAVVAFF
jgi:hypothetical protein